MVAPEPAPVTSLPRSPLRNRNFALLWTGSLVSDMGDWMLLIALPVYVFQLTGSALVMSSVFVAELIPALLVGQIAGVLVDRMDARRVLIGSGVIQALLLLPLVAVTAEDRLWIIYVVAAVQSGLARVGGPAKAALIPSLVPSGQLAAANSLSAVSDNLARLVGSPLGGVAIGLFGIVGIVALDAATFLASAVLTAGVRRSSKPNGERTGSVSLVADWIDGLRTIRRTPQLFTVVSIGALSQLSQGIFVVLFVVFVLRTLNGSSADVGFIRGVQAIGGILGGITIGAFSRRLTTRQLIGWGFVVFGTISLATWNAPSLTTAIPVYAALFVLAGIPGVATGTGLVTALQSLTPATRLGRVFAAFETAAGALQAVGVLIAGALADRIGVIAVLDAQASLYVLCGALALIALRRAAPGRARAASRTSLPGTTARRASPE